MLHFIIRLAALAVACLSLATHAADNFTPTTDFIDNGDGTVTHKLTGLTWVRCAIGQTWTGNTCTGTASTHTFDQAKALTATFAGHNDWRMPSLWELVTIVDYDIGSPAINATIFPNSPSSYFWSGSPYAYFSGYAWNVHFGYGGADVNNRSYTYSVRLVRGGKSFGTLTTPSSDFTDNGDGTVTHKKTGLTWKRCSEGQTWTGATCSGTATTYTHDQAVALTATFAGKADWRVPNIQELQSIVEVGAAVPVINTAIFPNTPSSHFWSGSPSAHYSNFAWNVSFGYGHSYDGDRSNGNRVRLVRGVQSSAPLPPPTSFLLSVTNSGSGTVTGTGISCGSDCSETYTAGTSVTLSASAAAGYNFTGWSGACSGASSTCSVTMDAAKNVTASFQVTAPTAGTTPNTFSFEAVTHARRATAVTSAPIIVLGINAPTPISISGGEYAINDGSFTATAGTVKLGNRITVRLTSPSGFNQTGSATLTIGGVSAHFDVTTLAFTPVAAASEVFSNPQTTSVSAQTIQITQAPTAPLQLTTTAPDNALVVLATDAPVQVVSAGATLSYTRREADTSFRVQTIGGAKSLTLASGSVDIAASASNVTIPVAGGTSTGATLVTQSAATRLIAGRDQNRKLVLAVSSGPVEYRNLTRSASRTLPSSFTIYPGEAVVSDDTGVPALLRLGSFAQNQGQAGDHVANPPLANAALKVPVVSGTPQRFNEPLSAVIGRALARQLGQSGSASLTQDSQSGVLTLTVSGQSYRYLPVGDLAIDPNTVRAVSTTEIAANLMQILDQGLAFAVAPALVYTDLESNLKLLDPQSTLEILGDGALLANVSGNRYVAQPAPELVPGGTGCPKFDNIAGQLALCDGSGYRQVIYPAFADTDNVIANFAPEIPTLTLQNAGQGNYTAAIPGSTLTVTPEIQLSTPPESQAGKLWWQEQDKVFVRYKNDTSQGFSLR